MSIRPLSPELQKKAQLELHEDPKRLATDIQHLKDWIAKQQYLRTRTDDQWLVAFLRGCKFSLERTKEKLDLYYSLYTTAPELYRIRHVHPAFFQLLETGSFIVLPKTAGPDSPRVAMFRPGQFDASKVHINDILSIAQVIQQIIFMEDDYAVVAGMVTVLDLEGVTMAHLLQMTPLQMKKMVYSFQDAAPIRLKGAHYLNCPTGFETIFNGLNALLNDKNKRRSFVHNRNYESLYKHVPQEILPDEYGGNSGSVKENIEYWKNKVHEYSAFLDEDLKCGTDESKRPGKPKTAEVTFGVQGSFRKLDFD